MDYNQHIPRSQLSQNTKKLPLAILAEPDPNYNPLQYPANIEHAKAHGIATRVGKMYIPPNATLCMCCGKNIDNNEIDIFCDLNELNHLGISYPLYYYFKRSCIVMLLINFLVSGIYQILSNKSSTSGQTLLPCGSLSSQDMMSAIGFFEVPNLNTVILQSALIFVGNVILFFLIQYYKGQQKKVVWDAHRDSHTPADYTVLVSGLDNLNYDEKSLLKFFNEVEMHPQPPIEAKKVCITYDIKELDELHRKRSKLIHERRKLDSKLNYHGHHHPVAQSIKEKAADLDNQIAECETSLEKLEQEYMDSTNNFFRLSGSVFLTLNTQRQSKNLQKRWKIGAWKIFLMSLCGCIFKRYSYEDRNLRIERAPQPSDVLFENLSVSSFTKLGKMIKSYFWTFITICISSLLLYGIALLKEQDTVDSAAENHAGNPIISYGSSFVVVIVNQILITVIKKFCSDEHHYSYTHFYRSIARKVVVAQFINTAVVPLLVRLYLVNHDTNADICTSNPDLSFVYLVANDMLPVFTINAISTPMLYLFDTSYFMRVCKRRNVEKDPVASDLSQCEVNSLFEGPALDIASRYAGFIKTLWAAAFYSFLIPLCVPISMIGLWLGYVIDRYLLARRFSTPIQLGKDLSKAMAGYVKEIIFFAALGNFIFGGYYYHLITGEDTTPIYGLTLAVLGLSVVNMVIPFKIYKCFIKKDHTLSDLTWEQVHLDFPNDYDRANPVTQAMAEEQVIREALDVETDPMRRSVIMNMLGKVQVRNQMEKSHIQGLYKYASTHMNLGDHYNAHADGHAMMPGYIPGHAKMKQFGNGGVQGGFVQQEVIQQQLLQGNNVPFSGIAMTNSEFIQGPVGYQPPVQFQGSHHHHHHHHHNNNQSGYPTF